MNRKKYNLVGDTFTHLTNGNKGYSVHGKESKYIDLIIGGHTHTFLKKPKIIMNSINKKVIINQVGWGGINIGKIDFIFKQNKTIFNVKRSSIFVKKK